MPSAPRTSERTYVLTVSFVHALVHATELTFAALLLRIEADFGTDLLLLGVLANVGAFAFGFGALPAGFLVDRLGTVPVLRLALAGSALTSLFVALADGEVMLGVGLTLLGLGTGLYHPAGITLLARTRRRARNLGLHGAVGNFGIAAAPAAAAALAVLVDWRAAYFLLAALAGLTFLWSLRLDGAGPVPDPDPVTPAGGDAAPRRQGRTALLLVYGAFVVSGLIYRGSLTFIPAHIEEQVSIALFGWEAAAVAGALSTVALMGGAIGWYGGGLAAERWRRPSLLLLLSPAVVAILLWMSFATDLGLLLAVFFFVIVSFAMQPSLVTLVAEYSPPGRPGGVVRALVLPFLRAGVVRGHVRGILRGSLGDGCGLLDAGGCRGGGDDAGVGARRDIAAAPRGLDGRRRTRERLIDCLAWAQPAHDDASSD